MKNPGRDWPLFILALDEENSASSSHEPRASGRSCTWGSRRDIHPGDRVRRSERRCLMRIADVRTCGPPAVGRAVASPLVNGCGAPTHLHFTGHHHHLGANAPPWHLGNVDAPERRDTKHTYHPPVRSQRPSASGTRPTPPTVLANAVPWRRRCTKRRRRLGWTAHRFSWRAAQRVGWARWGIRCAPRDWGAPL